METYMYLSQFIAQDKNFELALNLSFPKAIFRTLNNSNFNDFQNNIFFFIFEILWKIEHLLLMRHEQMFHFS